MHLRTFLLVAAAVGGFSLLGACSSQSAPPSPTAATPTDTAAAPGPGATPTAADLGPPEFVADRAVAHIHELAVVIGPRVAGSGNERRVAQYVRDALAQYGYSAEVQSFRVRDQALRAGAVDTGRERIDALPLGASGSGEARGQAVFVGLASEADVAAVDLQGKVAIADRGVVTFAGKYANVRARGAIALVIINNGPGTFVGTLQGTADIPVVAVGIEARDTLLAAAEGRDEVTVRAEPPGTLESVNVFASADPATACRVIVGAHHDSVPGAPGANDNASGTAVVLELARAMAADGLDAGLCFATFGAEEFGLHGSRAMVAALQASGALPQVMVNLDVTGIGDQVEVIGTSALVHGALEIAAQLGIPAVPSALPPNASSDHASFEAAGVPVVFFTSGDFSTIHTPEDRFEAVEPAEVERIGRVSLAVLRAILAGLPPFGGGS
ncbi:MAG: M20/M25/M40 family metallo-hydrolase [Chloroflexota bacterium]|nr:M20/M25/M40 family metallo-hydrolase [Dehalococcoidia bacterium]MDW8045774.1 M20/M25/M40 family metallo-hydrolase [Chloroflexota bacterium]